VKEQIFRLRTKEGGEKGHQKLEYFAFHKKGEHLGRGGTKS